VKILHLHRAAIRILIGITFAALAGSHVCRADDLNAPSTDAIAAYQSPDPSLENFSGRQALQPEQRAFFLDDSTSQPDIESDSGVETKAEAESAATLAKKTLNPVSDLISVPFQYNADFNIGPKNATRSLLNIQPVIPISISDNFNLIIRTIIPLISIDSVADGVSSQTGLGDINQSFFLSPKRKIGGWILGAGPVVLWPSATSDALGTGKYCLGPTAVALRQDGPFTYGILANQLWSFAGDDKRTSVNSMFLQPFVSYTFPTFTTVGISAESTYGWESHQTTIPINLTVTQILKIADQPISLQIGPRYYAENTPGGAQWGLRFTFTLLFPK
jgi:hypothetical protein